MNTRFLRIYLVHCLLAFDCRKGKYINIINRNCFLFSNKYEDIHDRKNKFFYDILLKKKFQKPCFQTILSREFDITSTEWYSVYNKKVKQISDKNVAEFNYKLLNNLLCNNYYLSKWKIGHTMYFKVFPDDIEFTQHLIYSCSNVQRIWNIVRLILNFEIKWKHIVLGFYHGKSDYIDFLNFLISFIACKIYKYKMFCRLESLDENSYNISANVKSALHVLLKCYYAFFLVCCGCDTSYIVSIHIQCQASIYTLSLCRGHSWRVRLAKQETLTPPGHLVSPLVYRGSVNVHRGALLFVPQ